MEAAAESVVCIGGPELLPSAFNAGERDLGTDLQSMVKVAEQLWQDLSRRCQIATVAHRWVHQHHSLTMSCRYRLWLYQQIWRLRTRIDQRAERHPQASTGKPFLP